MKASRAIKAADPGDNAEVNSKATASRWPSFQLQFSRNTEELFVREACPQLRPDLVLSRSDSSDDKEYIVKDIRASRFFRFREAEGFIASQLDGSTTIEEVRKRTELHFGALLPQSTIESFVNTLSNLGLLESPKSGQTEQDVRSSRIRGSLLYLRWKAIDPDGVFDALIGPLRWLFAPTFVALAAMLMLVAFGVTMTHYGTIGRRLPELYRLDIFILAWFVLFGVIVLHEFAHGLTCKHFGGHVHDLGFMLIFFQPAMYCNVSDAWLFPQLRKRLWVTFAGSFFEMFLWSLATLVWWVTDPNTLVNLLALVILLTSGIKTLFNLNPLIKLDGYYLLSDWLRIPNLSRRSFQYLRSCFARLLRLESSPSDSVSTARERSIYLVYGTLSLVFSYGLLSWVIFRMGDFLIGRFQGAGFLATMGLIFAFFHRPLLSRPGSTREKTSTDGSQSKRRRWPRIAALAVVVVAGLFLIRVELTVSAPFSALPVRFAEVRSAVEGIIEEVLVDEDEVVAAGQIIARLSDRAWRPEFDKVTAEIVAATARLKLLEKGPREEELQLARHEVETARARWERARHQLETNLRIHDQRLARSQSSIEKAQTQLEAARAEMERIRQLVSDGAGSPKELQDAVSIVAVREKELAESQGDLRVVGADDLIYDRQAAVVAEMEWKEADSRLTLLQAGSRPELVEAARAECARLEAQRVYCQNQMERLVIVAPESGVIVTPKIKEKVGQRVGQGDFIASIHDLSRIRAEIDVPEKQIGDLSVGQPVVLKVRAHPRQSFHGSIASIAPITTQREQLIAGRAIVVTAEFDNPSLLLKSEMTGQCKIYCGKRPLADVLSRRLLGYLSVEFWSWW